MLDKSIILCGFMGSGKTTVGKALAKAMKANYVDTDELLVENYKMSIPEIFEKYGEDYFRDLEHETAKKIRSMSPLVVSTGGGMLTFERNGKVLKDTGIIICLTRDFKKIYNLLKEDNTRPLAYNKSEEEIRELYDKRVAQYLKYAEYIIDNNEDVESCVAKITDIIDGT